MIICSNCGAINNEENGRFCRKCGALLPVSSRIPRIKIENEKATILEEIPVIKSENSSKEKKKRKTKVDANIYPSQAKFFIPSSKKENNENNLDLQAIPRDIPFNNSSKSETIPNNSDNINLKEIKTDNLQKPPSIKNNLPKIKPLKEVDPKPFNGSIIASKGVYGAPKVVKKEDIKKDFSEESDRKPKVSNEAITFDNENKRIKLEEDMSDVLSVLSKKFKIPNTEKIKVENIEKDLLSKQIQPSNMNEILKNLLTFDLHIEASAILKNDGILASAISSRISDTLLATIGQNLKMIGSDIIEGLSAGPLKSISLRGFNGVLDLAPIDKDDESMKDLVLIIFSHPKIRSGIINFATNIVRKQLKELLDKKIT